MDKHTSKQHSGARTKRMADRQKCDDSNSGLKFFDEAVSRAFMDLRSAGLRPNFLFLGNSVLHIATLNAFLLKLSSQGVNPCGVVCDNIDPSRLSQFNKNDIFAVQQANIVFLKRQSDFIFRDKPAIKEAINSCFPDFPLQARKSAGANKPLDQLFFLLVTNEEYPSPELWQVASTQGLPVRCVLLEEGVGSYVPQKSTHEFFAKKENATVKRSLRLLKEKVASPIRSRYRSLSRQICDIEHFGLLTNNNEALVPDRDYCYWMKKALEAQGRIKGSGNKSFAGHVIVVGTNFGELGDANTERLFLEKIVHVITHCGFTPYFRPHPRTKEKTHYESLGVEVDTNDRCPLEAIIASAQLLPVAIIGLGSSSQLLANVFWGIPSLTVASILEETANEQLSLTPTLAAYIGRLRLFDETFDEWFVSVSDGRDLKEKLMKIKSFYYREDH